MLEPREAVVLVLLKNQPDSYSVAVIRAEEPRLDRQGIALGSVQIPVAELHDIFGLRAALEYARRSLEKAATAEDPRFSR